MPSKKKTALFCDVTEEKTKGGGGGSGGCLGELRGDWRGRCGVMNAPQFHWWGVVAILPHTYIKSIKRGRLGNRTYCVCLRVCVRVEEKEADLNFKSPQMFHRIESVLK